MSSGICQRCGKDAETIGYKPRLGEIEIEMCSLCREKDVAVCEYREPNNKLEYMLVAVTLSSIDLCGESLDSFLERMLDSALQDHGYSDCRIEVRDATYDDKFNISRSKKLR